MKQQRWARPDTLAAAQRYNALARAHGLTPTQMALAFCYTNWRVASTIIGVTTLAQLDESLDAGGTTLSQELLAQIAAIRWRCATRRSELKAEATAIDGEEGRARQRDAGD